MSREDKVAFKKGPLHTRSNATDSGVLFFATDAGRLFLNTAQGQSIEIHSDLPFGTLPAQSNAVTLDKPVVLDTGLTVRIYGSRIPTQLNINSTGARNVKLNGSAVASEKSLENNVVLIYTYIQSENAWVVRDIVPIVANPVLSGTETSLTSLQIGDTKYKVEGSSDNRKVYEFGFDFSSLEEKFDYMYGSSVIDVTSLNNKNVGTSDYQDELDALYSDISTDPHSVKVMMTGVDKEFELIPYLFTEGSTIYTLEIPAITQYMQVVFGIAEVSDHAVLSNISGDTDKVTVIGNNFYDSFNMMYVNLQTDVNQVTGEVTDNSTYSEDFEGFIKTLMQATGDEDVPPICPLHYAVLEAHTVCTVIRYDHNTYPKLVLRYETEGATHYIVFENISEESDPSNIPDNKYVLFEYNEQEVEGQTVHDYIVWYDIKAEVHHDLTVDSTYSTITHVDGQTATTALLNQVANELKTALEYNGSLFSGDVHEVLLHFVDSSGNKACFRPAYHNSSFVMFTSNISTSQNHIQDVCYDGAVYGLEITYPAGQNDSVYVITHQNLAGDNSNFLSANPSVTELTPSLTSIKIKGNTYKIPSGGGAQVQSDWDQSNPSAVDFIKNRPFYSADLATFLINDADYVYDPNLQLSMIKLTDSILDKTRLSEVSGVVTLGDGTEINFDNTNCEASSIYDVNVLMFSDPPYSGSPLVISSNNFTVLGLPDSYFGTYILGTKSDGDWVYRVTSLSISNYIKQLDNKFISTDLIAESVYSIKSFEYHNYRYPDFKDYRCKNIGSVAFAESCIQDILFPSVRNIEDGAFLGCRLGKQSGNILIDFSNYSSINHLGGGLFAVQMDEQGRFRYDNVIGIAIGSGSWNSLDISPYVVNGIHNGVLAVTQPTDNSDVSSFISHMKVQGVYVAGSTSGATLSELSTIISNITDFSTIDDDWSTILTNINNGAYSQYLFRTKKAYVGVYDGSKWVESEVYLQCVGTDKDVDSSDNTVRTTWMFKEYIHLIPFNTPEYLQDHSMSTYAEGGWGASELRSILNDSTKFKIYYKDSGGNPVDLADSTVSVKKYYYNPTDSETQHVTDKYWIPSFRELNITSDYYEENIGTNDADIEDSGCVYDQYFTEDGQLAYGFNASRLKVGHSLGYNDGQHSQNRYWARSVSSTGNFTTVDASGGLGSRSAIEAVGVIVGLCLN